MSLSLSKFRMSSKRNFSYLSVISFRRKLFCKKKALRVQDKPLLLSRDPNYKLTSSIRSYFYTYDPYLFNNCLS